MIQFVLIQINILFNEQTKNPIFTQLAPKSAQFIHYVDREMRKTQRHMSELG